MVLFILFRQRQKQKTERIIRKQQELTVREIFKSEQNERIRIARDLHDSVGQKLAVMKMLMPPVESHESLPKVIDFLDDITTEVRNISHNLIPEILNFGLIKAVGELADRINSTENLRITFKANRIIGLPHSSGDIE